MLSGDIAYVYGWKLSFYSFLLAENYLFVFSLYYVISYVKIIIIRLY